MQCTHCEEEFEADSDGRYNTDRDWYCDDCYDDKYTTCASCRCEVVSDDTFEYHDDYYCDDCEESQFFTCSHCGDREHLGDGTTTRNGDRICERCDGEYYSHCECCDEVVPDVDWCSSCETCEDCCRCDYCSDCDEHNDECTCHYCEDCDTHTDDCTCETGPPIIIRVPAPPMPAAPRVSPFTDSGGSPVALIERLDESKFALLPANVSKVLGMLDKGNTLSVTDILGRLCTGDDGYFLISDIVHDVGKVTSPRYLYGIRSNEYDVTLYMRTEQASSIISKLTALGLTYRCTTSNETKVGLSFKVRKHKYRKCIEFLKFYCNI